MDPLTLIIVVVLVIILIGALPTWGYARGPTGDPNWGWGPSGFVAVILIVLLILILTHRI